MVELSKRFMAFEAAISPVNDVADILADPHIAARENIVTLQDDELGGPLRMQNVVGKLSRTPGKVRHSGPRLGQHNREILMERLGYTEDALLAAGIQVTTDALTDPA